MEFIAGALVTLVSIYFSTKAIRHSDSKLKKISITNNQSYRFNLLSSAGLISGSRSLDKIKTQATDYYDSNSLRVLIMEDMAYWIQNNELLQANIENGEMLPESTKRVDTMGMDSVELKKITDIVEKLTERVGNENRNPGNKEF
jgi:hypothetical protein